ncbi:MAG: hypothetical protein M1826_001368 [Phylliscum demangeonii]|nr:MAG: hypothetical protein M1826_001368 [Phylliscum demangeonii]
MSDHLKQQMIDFLDEIPDDKINHLYTLGIMPGTLFEGTLLRCVKMVTQLKKDIIEFLEGITDDKINHLYTPGITPGTLVESKLLRLDWQNSLLLTTILPPVIIMKQVKREAIEFLEEIPDDRINHLYTPGITTGLFFEGKRLRLDWQKFTSGKGDQKRYNVHVQTKKHRKKNANEKRCHKSESVAVALQTCVKMSDHLKKQMIEFLDEIPDDTINHVYTLGITPGLLFEGKLLRLD